MTITIVDASTAAAIVFGEPGGKEIASSLGQATLLAPTIFGYELANICATKLRRFPDLAAATLARYADRDRLQVQEHDVDHAACLELARRFGLTSYDASYLWLSRLLHAELVTLDQKLARAAAAA